MEFWIEKSSCNLSQISRWFWLVKIFLFLGLCQFNHSNHKAHIISNTKIRFYFVAAWAKSIWMCHLNSKVSFLKRWKFVWKIWGQEQLSGSYRLPNKPLMSFGELDSLLRLKIKEILPILARIKEESGKMMNMKYLDSFITGRKILKDRLDQREMNHLQGKMPKRSNNKNNN